MDDTVIRVLLVDDDGEYASMTRGYLRGFQNRKFELTWIADGEKAVEVLATGGVFHVILMDYYLQRQNGLEIAKMIAATNGNIPIILLTANKDFRIAIEAMKFGVEEYLVKDEVVDTILPRTIVNVVERAELKKLIQDAEKQKLLSLRKTEAVQELVVTMCHEFNNPLAAIKISTDILTRQKGDEEQTKLLGLLNQSIVKLEKQIVKLRDLNIQK